MVKRGFPPKPVDLGLNITLAEAGIKNRDNLIIEGKLVEVSTKAEETKKEEAPKEVGM